MKWKVPLFKSYWEEDDIESVAKVIRRGTYWATGPEIKEFEEKIAKFVGTKYALAFNSGTSALHANLLALNIKNSEIIVPSFTFIATANVVVLAGGKPIFAEIEKQSYGMNPEDVEKKITKKTKAIIPVHYGGGPCRDIKALCEIAEDNNLLLIEDAAESLGSKLNNKMIGVFGQSSMFSFCQNKIITAGEGGIIVTDSKNIYEKLKLIRSHGRLEGKNDYFSTNKQLDYIQIGYNFRMSSISAALLLSQFKKLDKIIKLRRKKAEYFNKKLLKVRGIKIPEESKGHYHVYQMYTIRLDNNNDREKLQKKLNEAGVMTKIYFEPIHLKTFYKRTFNYKRGDLPVTEEISQQVLSLPLFPTLKYEEIDYIVEKIKSCCE